MALLAHEARLSARAAGQRRALFALEAVLEGVRVGAVRSETTVFLEAQPPWVPLPDRAVLWLERREAVPPVRGLFEVEATIRYRAGRDLQTRTLTTRVWRPHGTS
jgi:hypothetical protein